MIPVDEAQARIVAAMMLQPAETVALEQAICRVLAEDVIAAGDQPPFPVSAMDGYAVRSNDTGPRRIIGSAPAGHPFTGRLGPGEAVRIFTGAVVPDGADAVVIQENAQADGDTIRFDASPPAGQYVRPRGLDFRGGETLATAGRRLTAFDVTLLAAGDQAEVRVRTKPRVAIAATGDELSRPGEPRRPGGIVASSNAGLAALVAQWGGAPVDLGILPDRSDAVAALADVKADLIVTLGGASVGEHDLIQTALGPRGFALDFWKVAMRPGKPLIFGHIGPIPLLGLPGNPVSALVTALLFLKPAILTMLGLEAGEPTVRVTLACALPANDGRQDYLRATLARSGEALLAQPAPRQDSAMLKILARADALIIRAPYAPVAAAGESVEILMLE